MRVYTIAITLLFFSFSAHAGKPWRGDAPALAKEFKNWRALVDELMEKQMYYGSLAAAHRTLIFHSDLPAKEFAYQKIIDLISLGYPAPLKKYFSSGDIEPSAGTPFSENYYFYKAITGKEMQMNKWAEHYFKRVDKEKSAKYLFWQGIQAYEKADLKTAEESFKKILKSPLPENEMPFVKKVARTLARIYFQNLEYEKAYNFYSTFLLRVNPINSTDWLEAAWNLYYLKRYEAALGHIYNLESKYTDGPILLEKYVLRALIYRDLCATDMMDSLLVSFENDFGGLVKGIKKGELLSRIVGLTSIFVPSNARFHEIAMNLEELKYERSRISNLSSSVQAAAKYLYDSEVRMHENQIAFYTEEANQRGALNLVTLAEKLRFLKFDVVREKFNPDVVFIEAGKSTDPLVTSPEEGSFRISWMQHGDFWRDERLKYLGQIASKCAN
jgi:tetratricopeptide (TPR) repeat protein